MALGTAVIGLRLLSEAFHALPCAQVLLAPVEDTLFSLDASEVAGALGPFLRLTAHEEAKLAKALALARAAYRNATVGRQVDVPLDVEASARQRLQGCTAELLYPQCAGILARWHPKKSKRSGAASSSSTGASDRPSVANFVETGVRPPALLARMNELASRASGLLVARARTSSLRIRVR